MNHRPNPFDKTAGISGIFEKLTASLEPDTHQDLLLALCQFVRFALIEKRDGWYGLINRHDLIITLQTSSNFGVLEDLSPTVRCCRSVSWEPPSQPKFLTDEAFLSTTVVEVDGVSYSMQDFVLSISYNLIFHAAPTLAKDKLRVLFDGFHTTCSEAAYELARSTVQVLVTSYSEVHRKLKGNNDAYNEVASRQPATDFESPSALVAAGFVPAATYVDSYLQVPVRELRHAGIRICAQLQLLDAPAGGAVFALGHRDPNSVELQCVVAGSMLVFRLFSNSSRGFRRTWSVPIEAFMMERMFKLEAAIYPSGHFTIGLEEKLLTTDAIQLRYQIRNGKLMIGAKLDGSGFGSFLLTALSLEAIDPRDHIKGLSKFGMYRLSNYEGRLAPNSVERLCLS